MRRQKRLVSWKVILLLLMIVTGLLFFFEWLGSDKPEKWVEEPAALPNAAAEPALNKD